MAKKGFLLHILFVLAISFHLQTSMTRSLSSSESESEESQSTTTILDVAASVRRTLDVLSLDPKTLKPTQLNEQAQKPNITQPYSSSSSSFSLSLHPRSAINKPHHKDYKELSHARLERDSARVKFISTKLELLFNRSDLKSVEPEDVQAPVTSGGTGEYFSRVGVGLPMKEYYMVIDTGSDVSWLQCTPCFDCYNQSDPIFDPSKSSTYRSLACSSPQCKSLLTSGCSSDSCLYLVSYGDGSYSVGNFATETLSFGGDSRLNDFAIGCGFDNQGLFNVAAGLIGLGGDSLSLPSQLKVTSLSYCLVDLDSSASSTLEFNSTRPGDSITAPMIRNPRALTFYYVGLTGMSIDGKPLNISPSLFQLDGNGRGGIIVDCGTFVTRLTTEAYNVLRDAFVQMSQDLPSTSGYNIFDTCYDLSSFKDAKVPQLSFQFSGGQTLTLEAKNYMIPVNSAGKFCFAFAPTNGPMSILGNIQQQGTRISFDIANSIVGFSPNKC